MRRDTARFCVRVILLPFPFEPAPDDEEAVKAMQAPDARDRLRADGSETAVSSPEEFEKWIAAELRKWAKVIKQAGITEAQ